MTDEAGAADEIGTLLLDRGDFQIRLAHDSCRFKSDMLVERMYSWRGYKLELQSEESCDETGTITVQACSGHEVFGTLNVGFDSQGGLACDSLYKAEIDAFRRDGAVASEFTRLAVQSEYGSKELLGALFHAAYLVAAQLGRATDMFIEVNPRHVAFYKRMLNFSPAGDCKICPRVDAPAVLLHLEVSYMRQQVGRCGGHRAGGNRSLYPYFCSPEEEADLIRRMTALRSGVARRLDAAALSVFLTAENLAHGMRAASA